jgi:hypothetical protein
VKPKQPGLLKVPVKPGLDEVTRHRLTHAIFALWCEDCVPGRSRGTGHSKKTGTKNVEEFECDHTDYSEERFKLLKDDQNRSQLVITVTHRATGACCSTVALRKGVWPYAVQILANFVIVVGQMKVRLRGDGEHPLQSLLAGVATKLRADGIIVDVPESTAVSGHQGIGSAEKHHDVIAGYARTYSN